MPDAFQPRDDLLPDVASFVIIDVRAVETGFGRERVFIELGAPARDARLDAEHFQQLGRDERMRRSESSEQRIRLRRWQEEVEPSWPKRRARLCTTGEAGAKPLPSDHSPNWQQMQKAQFVGDIFQRYIVRDHVALQPRRERSRSSGAVSRSNASRKLRNTRRR